MKGVNPHATRKELRAILQCWHTLALPGIGTKEFSVTLADFERGFGKVRQPYGSTMQAITANIDYRAPLSPATEQLGYGEVGKRLVRLCAALQAHHRNEPFFISARQAGEQLGVHFTDASKMLSTMVADGVLSLVAKGSGRVASRYRFTWVERPILSADVHASVPGQGVTHS